MGAKKIAQLYSNETSKYLQLLICNVRIFFLLNVWNIYLILKQLSKTEYLKEIGQDVLNVEKLNKGVLD